MECGGCGALTESAGAGRAEDDRDDVEADRQVLHGQRAPDALPAPPMSGQGPAPRRRPRFFAPAKSREEPRAAACSFFLSSHLALSLALSSLSFFPSLSFFFSHSLTASSLRQLSCARSAPPLPQPLARLRVLRRPDGDTRLCAALADSRKLHSLSASASDFCVHARVKLVRVSASASASVRLLTPWSRAPELKQCLLWMSSILCAG